MLIVSTDVEKLAAKSRFTKRFIFEQMEMKSFGFNFLCNWFI